MNTQALQKNLMKQRKRIAHRLRNPRINRTTFHTLRHFYGSMEHHPTKDILYVKRNLGHKNIQNTIIYINPEAALFQIRNDEFTVRVARSLDEACALIETGFDYVTDMEGCKIFRKRK